MSKESSSADFSKSAINSAVLRTTLQHPSVLYPGAVGILGGAAALLLGPSTLLLALMAGGISIAGLALSTNFGFRREYFANNYIKQLYQDMEKERHQRKDQLKIALKEVNSKEGLSQFSRLSEKFSAFEAMLGEKLQPGELTYGRYLGMAEQVYLAALDNLSSMVHAVKSMNVINTDYVNQRIQELNSQKSGPETDEEIESLKDRLELKQKQQKKVQSLLSQNEKAMTKMDLTIASIADMRTEEARASMDIEAAMNELQRLAHKAKDYSQ